MNAKHVLPSGATLEVQILSFEDAWAINATVLAVIEKLQIDLAGMDFTALVAADVLKFKGPICSILSSPAVREAATQCLRRCTYNGVRVGAETWNTVEGRGDYILAAYYALRENVAPFFLSLISFFAKK